MEERGGEKGVEEEWNGIGGEGKGEDGKGVADGWDRVMSGIC